MHLHRHILKFQAYCFIQRYVSSKIHSDTNAHIVLMCHKKGIQTNKCYPQVTPGFRNGRGTGYDSHAMPT